MPPRRITDLVEIEQIQSGLEHEVDRIQALSDVYVELPPEWAHLSNMNPFSAEYLKAVTAWLETITGRVDYDPARDELASYLETPDASGVAPFVPGIYRYGNSTFLGDMMQAFGAVLKVLDVRAGQSVLEYGPGDGQISLALARMGCRVTAVDLEARYLEQIVSQATALGTSIRTLQGSFGTAEPGILYDRILFFEAFHHALTHHNLARTLLEQLAPGGRIVFAGEPILAPDNYFRCTVPYAWGPRLDGLSLRAMRHLGWCELGFTREYFVEMLMRAGFVVEFHDNASTSRGSAYVATRADALLDLGGPMLIEAAGMAGCWHPGEGTSRFMRTSVAGIPISGAGGWQSLSLDLSNNLPVVCELKMTLGDWETSIVFRPAEAHQVHIPIPAGSGVLRLEGAVHRPCDLSPTSSDDRYLGVAVSRLQYHSGEMAVSEGTAGVAGVPAVPTIHPCR